MSDPSPCFEVSIRDKIAHIVMSRGAEFNTFTPQAWVDLPRIVKDIDRNARARVIVVSSTGKHFTAGMDLAVFTRPDGITGVRADPHLRAEKFRHDLAALQEAFTCLDQARVPVIAAVQGGCIGAGVDMVSACDIRLATKDAFFCIQEINIGMVADVGTLQRLPKLMPLGIVKELAYTGRRLGAAEAHGYGLVNAVCADAAATLERAMACAREIAAKPPVAIWGSKQALHYARDHAVDDALKQIGWLQGAVWSNAHVREAVTAMKQQRPGDFAPLAPLQRFADLG